MNEIKNFYSSSSWFEQRGENDKRRIDKADLPACESQHHKQGERIGANLAGQSAFSVAQPGSGWQSEHEVRVFERAKGAQRVFVPQNGEESSKRACDWKRARK